MKWLLMFYDNFNVGTPYRHNTKQTVEHKNNNNKKIECIICPRPKILLRLLLSFRNYFPNINNKASTIHYISKCLDNIVAVLFVFVQFRI